MKLALGLERLLDKGGAARTEGVAPLRRRRPAVAARGRRFWAPGSSPGAHRGLERWLARRELARRTSGLAVGAVPS